MAISGAGTGIGQAAAAKFAALGWRVAIGGRRVERLAETKSMIEDAGGTCLAHQLDVTDGGSVDRFFDAAEAELGTVTAVINNAATARYGPLDDFSYEDIAVEVATKLTGALFMAARGIRGMRKAGVGGDVVFVTSAAAVLPWVEHLPYAAANAGAEHAARILRLELEGSGIRAGVLRVGETIGTEFAIRWKSASCRTNCGSVGACSATTARWPRQRRRCDGRHGQPATDLRCDVVSVG